MRSINGGVIARGRVLLAIAIVLCPLGVTPGSAVAVTPTNRLVITGTETAWATLTVTKEVTYNLAAAQVAFSGRYGGFAIGEDWPTMRSVYVPRDRPTFFGQSATDGVLSPGIAYRVRLFTDGGPVTASIPWSAKAATLTPDQPLDADFQVVDAMQSDGPAEVTIGLPSQAGLKISTLVRYDRAGGSPALLRVCMGRSESSCEHADWLEKRPRPTDPSYGPTTVLGLSVTWLNDKVRGGLTGRMLRGEVSGSNSGPLVALILSYRP